jgi:hypothetical protein
MVDDATLNLTGALRQLASECDSLGGPRMHLNLGRLNGRGGAHPNSDNLAWECSGRELRGRKMKFDSRYWHKRAIEMRSIANETKNPQSKETMLGIAHDYDLLGYQFEYREKCTPRDVIGTEAERAGP